MKYIYKDTQRYTVMKKTVYIQLVLITAALANCSKPLYQQAPPPEQSLFPGNEPDSTNSCPLYLSDLPPDYYNWYYGFRPYGSYYYNPYWSGGFFTFRSGITRSGFGKSQGTVHS
jgi:hypothetical protein